MPSTTFNRRKLILSCAALAAASAAGAAVKTGADAFEAFGGTATGKRLERMQASPNFSNGAFCNLEPVVDPIDRDGRTTKMLQFLFEDQSRQRPSAPIPSVKTPLSSIDEGSFVWLGHSGFYLRLGGLSIAVDPALHACFPIGGFFKPFPGSDIHQPEDIPLLDVLLITHDHYDHLDMLTVKAIRDRVGRVICPLGVGAHLEAWGYAPEVITELDWSEKTTIGNHGVLTCLPSQHFSGRTMKRNTTLWAAFMLELDGATIFLSGDGGYGRHFAQIGEMWPHIDFAVLEDGQYNTDWAGIHLLPKYWRKAAFDLGLTAVLASHNSKFDLSRHVWTDPMETAAASAEVLKMTLVSPRIGEPVRLDRLKDFQNRWWRSVA